MKNYLVVWSVRSRYYDSISTGSQIVTCTPDSINRVVNGMEKILCPENMDYSIIIDFIKIN